MFKLKKKLFNWLEFIKWLLRHRAVPVPHIVKSRELKKVGEKFEIDTLVETGTYQGDMIEAQLNNFSSIISIELSEELAQIAQEKFKNKGSVNIIQGDSGKVLSRIVPEFKKEVLFWLDGHYSAGITVKGDKETPIMEELKTILSSDLKHTIAIDDARFFVGKNDYPKIEEIERYVNEPKKRYNIIVNKDIIFLFPI